MVRRALSDPTATRERILEVATSLFYERGVHAVGVSEIVARANASKLSLYRYFHSKEDLVQAMLTERSDRIHAWLERKTSEVPNGVERVLAIFDLLINWFAQPNYRGCAVINTVTDTRADPAIAAIARNHLGRYRALLEARLSDLEVEDPAGLARQLLLLIEGASVVTAIEGSCSAGSDARAAAVQLIRSRSSG